MSFNEDQGINLETISNQSGDTLLLEDDSDYVGTAEYETYAAKASRGVKASYEELAEREEE